MRNFLNSRVSRMARLALALSLTASSAFGVEFRAVNLKVIPPTAVVITPQTGLASGLSAQIFSVISQDQSMASAMANQGPVVVLDAGGAVLMVPQMIRPGAQALVMPQGGGKAELVPITKDMASALRQQMKDGDIAAAAKTLGHTFDASAAAFSASGAPVVAPEPAAAEKAPEAALAPAGGRTRGDQGTGKAPPAAVPAPLSALPNGQDWSDADLLNPAKRPQIKYGTESLPIIASPAEGTDISSLWVKAHAQATAATIVAYNFDDMDMAKSIVEKAKAGEKIVFIGDYSNWFPDKMPQAKHGGRTTPRTEAMNYVIENLPATGGNLELYILKGLGDIGINHNKFTVFRGPNGKLLQGGSFNYTKTSQQNHWELVVFTEDAERIDAFERYAAWLQRRARKFDPKLNPEDPKFDPADPIPTVEPSADLKLHGVPFPKVVFSPNGQGESILVKAINLAKAQLRIAMFSPFPTPDMVAAIVAGIGRKVDSSMIADAGQVANATPVVGLIDSKMSVKDIHGPDMEVQHKPSNLHSKQHEKDMGFDADMIDGIVKMADSLNISRNAFSHNFENIQLWNGFYAKYFAAHYRYLWSLAHDLAPELVQKLRDKLAGEKKGKTAHLGPWNGAQPTTTAVPKPARKRTAKKPAKARSTKKPARARTT
ncbi:MAG: hypothetical protein HY077_09230 [Elusimicrobia bacterium]|nr:hypothetical protein [Elusimicrobiota bacterium]